MTGEGKFRTETEKIKRNLLKAKRSLIFKDLESARLRKWSSGLWLLPETADYLPAATSLIIAIGRAEDRWLASSNMTNINPN